MVVVFPGERLMATSIFHSIHALSLPSHNTLCRLTTPRPEGVRCLVIAANGRTAIRARSGALLHTVATGLPGGGGGGGAPGGGGPIALDCVLQPAAVLRSSSASAASIPHLPGTLYALDLLAWVGVDFTAGDAEFRVAWLASKMAEEVGGEGGKGPTAPGPTGRPPLPWVPVLALPTWPADPAGLAASARWEANAAAAAAGGTTATPPPPPVQDGILLRHRAAPYAGGAATPLALLWKDGRCSRHLVDGCEGGGQGEGGGPPTGPTALLRVGSVGCGPGGLIVLETGDDPPVALAVGFDAATPATLPPLAPGHLVKATISAAGGLRTDPADGRPVGLSLSLLEHLKTAAGAGASSSSHRRPDALSKLVFQVGVREGKGVGLEELCGAMDGG